MTWMFSPARLVFAAMAVAVAQTFLESIEIKAPDSGPQRLTCLMARRDLYHQRELEERLEERRKEQEELEELEPCPWFCSHFGFFER